MHQPVDTPVVARFVFKEDRAHEFTFDGRLVMEVQLETTNEAMEYVEQFADALVDANVLIDGTSVVNLSDFLFKEGE